jgi:hypothetical protein
MRLVKPLFFLSTLPAVAAAAWWAYGNQLQSSIGTVEIREVTALAAQNERTLPFFELMSPLPPLENTQVLPRLDYKKGPPDRFLEHISVSLQDGPKAPKERIIYYGRHSRTDLAGIGLLPEEPAREAHYLEVALRLSQGQETAGLPAWKSFLLRPVLLREAAHWLQGVDTVYVMDQAGTPAFLFSGSHTTGGRARDTALFIRRNSFYRVDYLADHGFRALDPLNTFRKSFLTERRSDAMEFVARNLSEVHMEKEELKTLSFRDIAWPILLLAANVSVDPASLEAYFHFAGISALLYRSQAVDPSDVETIDTLRNNVLASEFYARDIAPEARKTAEIGHLARLLTRNFE